MMSQCENRVAYTGGMRQQLPGCEREERGRGEDEESCSVDGQCNIGISTPVVHHVVCSWYRCCHDSMLQ